MSVEKAKQEVERREKALLKLTDEREKLSQGIGALERKKAAAERALAMGDETQRKIIRKIEDEIDRSRLKGLEALISDAEAGLNEARGTLKEAEAERKARLAVFIEQKENQRRENIKRSYQDKAKRYADLYLEWCNLASEDQVEGIEVLPDGTTMRGAEMERFFHGLTDFIDSHWKGKGYIRLPYAGWPASIFYVPLLSPNAEGVVPGQVVDVGQVAMRRRNNRLKKWEEEFMEKEVGR